MNTVQQIEKIERLHRLIVCGNTGDSYELALKIGVARRTVQTYLQELRDYGADIVFDSLRKTYVYKNNFEFKFVFEVTVTA
ncbi:MAG: HTH domain-containing protein [Niameybacter sp.]